MIKKLKVDDFYLMNAHVLAICRSRVLTMHFSPDIGSVDNERMDGDRLWLGSGDSDSLTSETRAKSLLILFELRIRGHLTDHSFLLAFDCCSWRFLKAFD
jgi:hypothetical protein